MTDQITSSLPVKAKLANRPLGIAEIVSTARHNLLEILPEMATRQPIISGKTFRRWHMVMEPRGLRQILRDNPDSYPKAEIAKNIVRPAIGNSIFVAEGEDWYRQRMSATPAFLTRNIRSLAPIMSAASQTLVERIVDEAPTTIDMCEAVTAATFEVISDVTFADGADMDRALVHQAIDAYLAGSAKASILDIIGAPSWIPRFRSLISEKSVRDMKRMAEEIIEKRCQSSEPPPEDFLTYFNKGAASKSGNIAMNRNELRDNLLTIIVAGHETTALALSWSLYLLAFDQDVQNKVRKEVQAKIGQQIPTAHDLNRLPMIRRVVFEAMRLYPPAALLLRTALHFDIIAGREIHPGDTMLLPIYALHRSHCFWQNPDHFMPDRFQEPQKENSQKYLPFGTGPRSCIGSGFAMQEAIIMLAALVSRLKFKLVPNKEPKPVMILTLRPNNGVWLQVEPAES